MSEDSEEVYEVWNPKRDAPSELNAWLQSEVEAAIVDYVKDGHLELNPPSWGEEREDRVWQLEFACPGRMEHATCKVPLEAWLLEKVQYALDERDEGDLPALKEILIKALRLLDE